MCRLLKEKQNTGVGRGDVQFDDLNAAIYSTRVARHSTMV
jgi:hypothetical protein